MIPDFSLCRFAESDGIPRLGLISNGQLFDLSASGRACYATLQSWLVAACGRTADAMQKLLQVAANSTAVCSASALADPDQDPLLLCPLDTQEVWACGVTYEMSREARVRESDSPTVYGQVYEADRPEIFFKATPHRVVGPGEAVGIRADSEWNAPEPELTLVVTPSMEIVGYTVGNDMSSRDIEGENPLYVAQAKIYSRSCALGPVIRLALDVDPMDLAVQCAIYRDGVQIFSGETQTSKIHRRLDELVSYLGRCNSFPAGLFVVTGTGIVPPDTLSLEEGDRVDISIEGLGTLSNPVIVIPID